MSKRCQLQKEYYKEFGNYKGDGKYTDHYVNWLESRVLELTIPVVLGQSEQLTECKHPFDSISGYKVGMPYCNKCRTSL